MPHSNPLHNQIQLRNLQNLNFSQTRTQHRITQIKNRAQTEKLKIRKFQKKKKHTSTASLLMVKVFFPGHFQVTQITWVNIQFFIYGLLHFNFRITSPINPGLPWKTATRSTNHLANSSRFAFSNKSTTIYSSGKNVTWCIIDCDRVADCKSRYETYGPFE